MMDNASPLPVSYTLRRQYGLNILLCVCCSFCTVLSSIATAADSFPGKHFGRIILFDNHRKKPLGTFADQKLVAYSGRHRYHEFQAHQWLARVLFTPGEAADDTIFLINNPAIPEALNIPAEKKRRYSCTQLYHNISKLYDLAMKASDSRSEEQNSFEREVIRTYTHLQDFVALSNTFGFFFPDSRYSITDTSLAHRLNLPVHSPAITYYQLYRRNRLLSKLMHQAQERQQWSQADSEVVVVTHQMFMQARQQKNQDHNFRVFPALVDGKEQWLSPWDVVTGFHAASIPRTELDTWKTMFQSFRDKDFEAFDSAAAAFSTTVRERTEPNIEFPDPSPELLYNTLRPFFWAKLLYGIGFLLILLSLALPWQKMNLLAVVGIVAGALPHGGGIILRMIIMQRAPVATLFETFVFVSLSGVVLGLLLRVFQRGPTGTIVAALSGFAFLHIAGRYGANQDTMGMLAAVLNNNFWLATHIITISLGYAGVCGAGIAGHLFCIGNIFRPGNTRALKETDGAVYAILAFGLTFTLIGTVLGGMWADQSWGRFWGWDPKENGALLIILWCSVVFHARSGRIVKGFGTAVGAIVGMGLVMFAWIGVNLLGIGMHAYGFTSSGARLLVGYLLAESIFILVVLGLELKQRRSFRVQG